MSNEKREMVRIVDNSKPYVPREQRVVLNSDTGDQKSVEEQYELVKDKPGNPMVHIVDNSIPKRDAEEKEYMICYTYYEGNTEWKLMTGRREVYEDIKDNIDNIDPKESYVLVENVALAGRKDVYTFMKYAQEIYVNDNFDIRDYYDEGDDVPDEIEAGYRTQEGDLYSKMMYEAQLSNKAMDDIMNGNVDKRSL